MPESLQTAAEALLDRLPQPDAKPIPDYTHLTRSEEALILKLAKDGLTQTAIAQRLECSQPTVSRVINEFSDTSDLGKQKAHNLALKAVLKLEQSMDAAAEKGTSGPMDSILKIAGVLGDESQGPRVIVQIGVKDSDVSVNLSPMTFASDAPNPGAGSH